MVYVDLEVLRGLESRSSLDEIDVAGQNRRV